MQRTRQLRLIIVGLFLLPLVPPVRAGAPITVSGGREVLWATRLLPAADGAERWVFAYTRTEATTLRIYSLPMRASSGVIRQAAVRGPSLHVFFRDGTHYRFRPPQNPLAPAQGAASNDFPERVLPGKQTPLALCGDDAADRLYAVVKARTAERIPPPPTTQPVEDLINTSGASSTDIAANPASAVTTAPAVAIAPADAEAPDENAAEDDRSPRYALVSYRASYWMPEAAIPAFFDKHTSCWLAAEDGHVWLLYALPDAPGALWWTQWDGQTWSDPKKAPDLQPEDLLATGIHDAALLLIVRKPSGGSSYTVHTLVLGKDGVWTSGAALQLEGQVQSFATDEASFGRLGENIIGIWQAAGEEDAPPTIRVARWMVAGGDPLTAPDTVPALMSRQATLADERTRMLVATLALTGLLLVAFMRRRDSFLTDLPVPAGFVLARLGKRFLAFVIDSAIMLAVVAPLVLVPWMMDNNIQFVGPDTQAQIDYAMMQDREGFFWRWMLGVGVYMLYGVVFESVWAATPGKLVLGLRVRNHRAERASFTAILLRNVLRFEVYPLFQFAPIAVLVALTRNRQRLGDLVANTIVVEKV